MYVKKMRKRGRRDKSNVLVEFEDKEMGGIVRGK